MGHSHFLPGPLFEWGIQNPNPTPHTAGRPPSSGALRILQAGCEIGSRVLGSCTHTYIYILGFGFIYSWICIHMHSYIFIYIYTYPSMNPNPKPQTHTPNRRTTIQQRRSTLPFKGCLTQIGPFGEVNVTERWAISVKWLKILFNPRKPDGA